MVGKIRLERIMLFAADLQSAGVTNFPTFPKIWMRYSELHRGFRVMSPTCLLLHHIAMEGDARFELAMSESNSEVLPITLIANYMVDDVGIAPT